MTELATVFQGVELPPSEKQRMEEVVSGRAYIRLLALSDLCLQTCLEDSGQGINRNNPIQTLTNWHILQFVLEELGWVLDDAIAEKVICGNMQVIVQLANDIRSIANPSIERNILRRGSAPLPLVQRSNPFLDRSTSALGQIPTRMYIADSTKFKKKRVYLTEQLELIAEQIRKREEERLRKAREAALKAAQNEREAQLAMEAALQDQLLRDSRVVIAADPGKVKEKARKTDLLAQLEALETAASADKVKLAALKKHEATAAPESPTHARHYAPQHKGPVKQKEPGRKLW
jgi:hypothetical protein